MKKSLSLLFLTLISSPLHAAYEATVIVLEAPLLKDASYSSKVLATLRKGDKLQIPNNIVEKGEIPDFLPTLDRAGNTVFVPTKYVKIIYNDNREYLTSINYPVNDPTDYRLQEPISKIYPFDDSQTFRASFAYHIGSNFNSNYDYAQNFTSKGNSFEHGFRVTSLAKATHDPHDRFYFGFIGYVNTLQNEIHFTNGSSSRESHDVYRVGPFFNYDAYKTFKHRLSIGAGFTYNFHRTVITREDAGVEDTRIFDGYSLSPLFNLSFIRHDLFPYTDIVAGFDASFYLPHSLKTKDEAKTNLWTDEVEIKSSLKIQTSAYLGLQFKY